MAKELLFSITKKDFKISYFSGTGAGGQHRNKHQNCVRMTHIESGVSYTGQSNRDRNSNLKEAFKAIVNDPHFLQWHRSKTNEVLNKKTLEQKVLEQMHPDNLKVEGKVAGKWTKLESIQET